MYSNKMQGGCILHLAVIYRAERRTATLRKMLIRFDRGELDDLLVYETLIDDEVIQYLPNN